MIHERFHTQENMQKLVRDLYVALLKKGFFIDDIEYDQYQRISYVKLGLK